jgi:hypothetical protein
MIEFGTQEALAFQRGRYSLPIIYERYNALVIKGITEICHHHIDVCAFIMRASYEAFGIWNRTFNLHKTHSTHFRQSLSMLA